MEIIYGCPLEGLCNYGIHQRVSSYTVQDYLLPWEKFPPTISFAAEPYERLDDGKLGEDPNSYLLYGKVGENGHLEIGFRPFTFVMTQDLHSRLGLVYELVAHEYSRVVNK